MTDHDLNPDEFNRLVEQARNQADDMTASELTENLLAAVEGDHTRTTEGALALGYVEELHARLNGGR